MEHLETILGLRKGGNHARLEISETSASTTPSQPLNTSPPPREASLEIPHTPLPPPRVAGRTKSTTAHPPPNSDLTGTTIVETPENMWDDIQATKIQQDMLTKHVFSEAAYACQRFDDEAAYARQRFDDLERLLQTVISDVGESKERIVNLEGGLFEKLIKFFSR